MRLEKIDSVKGLGILLVVLGHTKNIPEALHFFIYSFHMPLFFIVSGVFFSLDKSAGSGLGYIKKKFIRLIIPAWVLGAICSIPFLLMLILNYGIDLEGFSNRLLGTMTGYPFADGNFMSTPLWFLFALFWVEVLAFLFGHSYKYFDFLSVVTIALGLFFSYFYHEFTLYFNFNIALTSYVFFYIGFKLKRIILGFEFNFYFFFAFFLSLLVTLLGSGFDSLSLSRNYIGTKYFFFVNIIISLLMSFIVITLSRLYNYSFLRWFGVNTLVILAFDYYVNSIVFKALDLAGLDESWVLGFVIRVAVLSLLCLIISKIDFLNTIINGRKKH